LQWHVLETGPLLHRLELRRAREEGNSVARFLESDHSRLQTILLDVERLVFEDEFTAASKRCAEFICGLRHHLRMEDDVLLPLMARLGRNPQVVAELQQEHREICRVVAELERAIQLADRGHFVAVERTLERILSAHNVREEQVLHPMVDHLVGGDAARAELVQRLQLV
jgi:iron-sulfur cluster repair protein YtfE (RIC family)